MLPKYASRRSHWLFFGKVRSGLGSRAQRTLERIRPAKGASRTAPFFLPSRGLVGPRCANCQALALGEVWRHQRVGAA